MRSATVSAKDTAAGRPKAHALRTPRRNADAAFAREMHAAPLTAVLGNRRLTSVLVLTAAAQAILAAAGLFAWRCPFKSATSLPCPACGMTSGVVHLLHGRWDAALRANWLSPLLLAAAAAAVVSALMPAAIHGRLIEWLEAVERQTAVVKWIGVCLGVTWIWRIAGGL